MTPLYRSPAQVKTASTAASEDHDLMHVHAIETGIFVSHRGNPVWLDAALLRDSCRCSRCMNPSSGQKEIDTVSIPLDVSIASAEGTETSKGFTIHWREDPLSDHTSFFSPAHLERLISAKNVDPAHPSLWDEAAISREYNANNLSADFEHYQSSSRAFNKILSALGRFGLAFITNVPGHERSVEQIGKKIGPLRHTFYGRTWDVKDKPNAENVAYTATELGLHMDLLYMKQPPGLQLLHCINASDQGGKSFFSDSFAAANALYKEGGKSRSHFQTLTDYQVPYHYNQPGKAFFDTKPVLEIDRTRERFLVEDDGDSPPLIKFVNWSPPFQAPFTANPDFRKYHKASRAFSKALHAPGRIFELSLPPGHCVIFNNRRILHGRRAFKSTGADKPRWLKGAYLDTDDFESQLRAMKQ